jgi:hypothetical protein
MTDIFDQLSAPFDPSEIDWRVGSTNGDKTKGMALAYIDARAVMDRLDTVVGPSGWQCRYMMGEGKTVCELSVKCGDEWVTKSDGAGNTDFEAEKGALSDAFKRAAVRWGIGRYLYSIASPWVPIEAKGKSHFITAEGKRILDNLLRGNKPAPVQQSREEPAAPKKTDWDAWKVAAATALVKKESVGSIASWRSANGKAMEALKQERPALWREIDTLATECAEELARKVA